MVNALRSLGVTIWWDEDMRGVDWQEELEQQIIGLAAVIVLWTPNSVASKHVKDEARLALEADKLINAVSGVPKPPFPYDRVNGLPLDSWDGREPHGGWRRLIETVDGRLAKSDVTAAGAVIAALGRLEEDRRNKQKAFGEAQGAFQAAQLRDGEAAEAVAAAGAALKQAEEQHHRVVNMRATPAVQRTAQQELDAARAAKQEADQDHRLARADLSEASRNLTRAEAALEAANASASAPAAHRASAKTAMANGAKAQRESAAQRSKKGDGDRPIVWGPWIAASLLVGLVVLAAAIMLSQRQKPSVQASGAPSAANPAAQAGAIPSPAAQPSAPAQSSPAVAAPVSRPVQTLARPAPSNTAPQPSAPAPVYQPPPVVASPPPAPPPNDALAGAWRGVSVYTNAAEPAIDFDLDAQVSGDRISGRMSERNTFAPGGCPYLYATIEGQISGDSVRFTKTYSGTCGQTHSVQYQGLIDRDAMKIDGTWSISSTYGRFSMSMVK